MGHQDRRQKLPVGGRGASFGVREEQSLRPPSWLRSFCPWREHSIEYRVQSTEYRSEAEKKTDSGEHVFMTPEFPDEKNMLFLCFMLSKKCVEFQLRQIKLQCRRFMIKNASLQLV